jgi:HK97 family phage portal protein
VILKTRSGDQKFSGPFDSSVPIPVHSQYGNALSYSGRRVNYEDAIGLPAFFAGVRLISETIARLPAKVYSGQDEEREPVRDTSQAKLLRNPAPKVGNIPGLPTFQVWSFTVVAMIRGNGYLWKQKNGNKVEALYPIDPRRVTPKYDKGVPRFEIRDQPTGKVTATVGPETITHLPGILLNDPHVGVSVIEAFRHGLGTQLARQEFEARYLANDGRPSIIATHPENRTREQRDEFRQGFEARHTGASNAGRLGILWGGWDVREVAASMQDSQFIELANFSVQDVARMLNLPSGILNAPTYRTPETVEQENTRALQYGYAPWMERLEDGLENDPDLFPTEDLEVEFDASELLRADIQARYDAYSKSLQTGWQSKNEVRAKEGLPPKPGGDELQQTPVGGAPNTGDTPPPPPPPQENP